MCYVSHSFRILWESSSVPWGAVAEAATAWLHLGRRHLFGEAPCIDRECVKEISLWSSSALASSSVIWVSRSFTWSQCLAVFTCRSSIFFSSCSSIEADLVWMVLYPLLDSLPGGSLLLFLFISVPCRITFSVVTSSAICSEMCKEGVVSSDSSSSSVIGPGRA